MRTISLSILLLLASVINIHAQQVNPLTDSVFTTEELSQINSYFSNAEFTEKGQLVLIARESYVASTETTKSSVINKIAVEYPGTMIVVKSGTKNELWSAYEPAYGSKPILDWDLNASYLKAVPEQRASGTSKHPFFVYVGGQGILDSERNLNAAINTRVGFFLLKNKWDLAWTFTGGISGVADTSSVFSNRLSTGIMSKYYFPIPKLNISPNVGVDLQSTLFTDSEGYETTSSSGSILAGIAWYIGPGSLDAGVRINKQPSFTIGYTLMPGNLKKK